MCPKNPQQDCNVFGTLVYDPLDSKVYSNHRILVGGVIVFHSPNFSSLDTILDKFTFYVEFKSKNLFRT